MLGTLGGDGVIVLGGLVVSTLGEKPSFADGVTYTRLKMLVSSASAWSCALPRLGKGVVGAGWSSAWVSVAAASLAASTEELTGMLQG